MGPGHGDHSPCHISPLRGATMVATAEHCAALPRWPATVQKAACFEARTREAPS